MKKRVDYNVGKPQPEQELKIGPNIKPWPEMAQMPENLMLVAASVIFDDVTTTDELIPSGETSSYRSNPIRLSELHWAGKILSSCRPQKT